MQIAHQSAYLSARFSPQGSIFAAGSEKGESLLYTLDRNRPFLTLTNPHPVTALCVDRNEEMLVAGLKNGAIKVWDLEHSKAIRTLLGHKIDVAALEFHPFGDFFASGHDCVKVWDIRKKACIQTYDQSGVYALRMTPDGRWVAAASRDGLCVWDMTAGKQMYRFPPAKDFLFHPTECALICLTQNAVVAIDMDDGSELSRFEQEAERIAVHEHGDKMALVSDEALSVVQWDSFHIISTAPITWSLNDLVFTDSIYGLGIDRNVLTLYSSKEQPKPSSASMMTHAAESIPKERVKDPLPDQLLFDHEHMVSTFKRRLEKLRKVREAWTLGVTAAIEEAIQQHDSHVQLDLIRLLNLKPKLVDFDACGLLLHIIADLLTESHHEFHVTSLQMIQHILKQFGEAIQQHLYSIDRHQKERAEKAMTALKHILQTLSQMRKTPGHVGSMIRDTAKLVETVCMS